MKRCRRCNKWTDHRTQKGLCPSCSAVNSLAREAWVTRPLAQGNELSAEEVRPNIKDLF